MRCEIWTKTGYTAVSCGQVGRGGYECFRFLLTNRPTDRPTDRSTYGWTDKASYRVACPQLKKLFIFPRQSYLWIKLLYIYWLTNRKDLALTQNLLVSVLLVVLFWCFPHIQQPREITFCNLPSNFDLWTRNWQFYCFSGLLVRRCTKYRER